MAESLKTPMCRASRLSEVLLTGERCACIGSSQVSVTVARENNKKMASDSRKQRELIDDCYRYLRVTDACSDTAKCIADFKTYTEHSELYNLKTAWVRVGV